MPVIKSQEDKSPAHVALQPKTTETSIIQLIMAYDLCGWGTGAIARELGYTDGRISIIKNSPLYKQQVAQKRAELHQRVLAEQSGKIVAGDPVEIRIKAFANEALSKKIELVTQAKSEFVQSAAASDLLDRAGYVAKKNTTTRVIEVTEKMADRFAKALERPERTVTMREITTEE